VNIVTAGFQGTETNRGLQVDDGGLVGGLLGVGDSLLNGGKVIVSLFDVKDISVI